MCICVIMWQMPYLPLNYTFHVNNDCVYVVWEFILATLYNVY